jgi:release factor glutamine methyltransferase
MYLPGDDSYLLQEALIDFLEFKSRDIKILDLGTGSGIQALACKEQGFKNILAADIDNEAVKTARKLGIKAVHSDLFSKIKAKFDLIIFNPPYLPEDKFDSGIDTTAGKKGYELIIKFLKQAKSHLNKEGKILLLISSLSHPNIIKNQARKFFQIKKISEKRIFFEVLEVWILY